MSNGVNLFSKQVIKNLLKSRGLRPLKYLGQNFLIDRGIVKKIILAANLRPKDVILEIGPGIGTITNELSGKVRRIIAVEKDYQMVKILEEILKDSNIKIVNEDILNFLTNNEQRSLPVNYRVVANLPFYITAPTIRMFLESPNPPKEMVLIVQKEVGQRICAKPPRINILAISVQFYAACKIISYVSKKSFWPRPKVDSAILRITPLINADRKLINIDLFFKIVRAGFSQPRKQLINNLSQELKTDKIKVADWLFKNDIHPSQRAATLSVKDWIKLTKSFVL